MKPRLKPSLSLNFLCFIQNNVIVGDAEVSGVEISGKVMYGKQSLK